MQRVVEPEQMDDPAAPREELDASLAYIRWVNRVLGGTRGLLGHLARWSARWPKDRPVTLLDIGTGSADIPLAAVRWARSRGFDLRITAIDLHPTTLELARRHIGPETAITLVQADALRLADHYGHGSFDYVHAGMFLHHLRQLDVWTVLRIMDRLARAGIVWNDLLRSRTSLTFLNAMLIGQGEMVRHDARASIRAGFTRAEVLDAAKRLELSYTRYYGHLSHRFTLAGERPSAWR
jgi:2-polyprenyl-3-methyl-5-hydroxy-6-metoxy-1,4-benzoquinol methylase